MANSSIRNKLLAALPPQDYEEFQPYLEPVPLFSRQILCEASHVLHHVWFPYHGVVSILNKMKNGAKTEIATVGNEGVIGLSIFLGNPISPAECMCQVPGDAMRIKVNDFKKAIRHDGSLHVLLQRYTHAFIQQIGQAVACNLTHSLEQRCARWLLMTYDRVHTPQFSLKQEFLAQMLGVRRAGVSGVARRLQEKGLIDYKTKVSPFFGYSPSLLARPFARPRNLFCHSPL